MTSPSAGHVDYQPRHRSRWWPDVVVALLILLIPLLMIASHLATGGVRHRADEIAGWSFLMGMLLPWLPAVWTWFRMAPALGRVVERDFRLDLALTLRSPREVLAGELASRALVSTLPALALILVVMGGGGYFVAVERGQEMALVVLIGGFCFVVATPVMVLVAWATLSIMARRRLAVGNAGWLAWSMIQMVVATVYLVIVTYLLEFGVIMMLVFVALLVEQLGDPTEAIPIVAMLVALVVVTATIAGALGWIVVSNLRGMARELWWFEATAPPLGASPLLANLPPEPPLSPATFARVRWVLAALAVPVVAFEGVGLSYAMAVEDGTVPEGFLVLSGVMAALVLLLSAWDIRVVLARLRVDATTREASAPVAAGIVAVRVAPWMIVALTLVSLPAALVAAGWPLANPGVRSFDPYRNWDVMSGLLLGAVWLMMAVVILALIDATAALRQPPTRPTAAAVALRVLGYPSLLVVSLMFAAAMLMAPTLGFGFFGAPSSERLTVLLVIAVWGGLLLLAMAALTGWVAWRWMRAWDTARQPAATVVAS